MLSCGKKYTEVVLCGIILQYKTDGSNHVTEMAIQFLKWVLIVDFPHDRWNKVVEKKLSDRDFLHIAQHEFKCYRY